MILVFWGATIVGNELAIWWLANQGDEPRSTDGTVDMFRPRHATAAISARKMSRRSRESLVEQNGWTVRRGRV